MLAGELNRAQAEAAGSELRELMTQRRQIEQVLLRRAAGLGQQAAERLGALLVSSEEGLGLEPDQIERVVLSLRRTTDSNTLGSPLAAVTTGSPYTRPRVLQAMLPRHEERRTEGGGAYFANKSGTQNSGRPAGTVEGFLYSREFLKRLQGVIWTRETLDIWITDSQAWVPGSMMFYKQPDPEARRKIIAYLSNAK